MRQARQITSIAPSLHPGCTSPPSRRRSRRRRPPPCRAPLPHRRATGKHPALPTSGPIAWRHSESRRRIAVASTSRVSARRTGRRVRRSAVGVALCPQVHDGCRARARPDSCILRTISSAAPATRPRRALAPPCVAARTRRDCRGFCIARLLIRKNRASTAITRPAVGIRAAFRAFRPAGRGAYGCPRIAGNVCTVEGVSSTPEHCPKIVSDGNDFEAGAVPFSRKRSSISISRIIIALGLASAM